MSNAPQAPSLKSYEFIYRFWRGTDLAECTPAEGKAIHTESRRCVMEWGIIMAIPTVIGMLVLIFAQPRTKEYQTFGSTVLNEPQWMVHHGTDTQESRKAA
jgi:hypothetical protein